MLELRNVNVKIDSKKIVENFNLSVNKKEVHVLMGPNGSGKSSLIYGILKHPKYIFEGEIILDGEDVSNLGTDELAKKGLTAIFQNPIDLEEIKLRQLLWYIVKEQMSHNEFQKKLKEFIDILKIDEDFLSRGSFSGGEKKRIELLQILFMNPKYLFVDEIDSGVDIDNLQIISSLLNSLKKNTGLIVITHYSRILNFIDVDYVHVYVKGKIVKSGDKDLANYIEKHGYEEFLTQNMN